MEELNQRPVLSDVNTIAIGRRILIVRERWAFQFVEMATVGSEEFRTTVMDALATKEMTMEEVAAASGRFVKQCKSCSKLSVSTIIMRGSGFLTWKRVQWLAIFIVTFTSMSLQAYEVRQSNEDRGSDTLSGMLPVRCPGGYTNYLLKEVGDIDGGDDDGSRSCFRSIREALQDLLNAQCEYYHERYPDPTFRERFRIFNVEESTVVGNFHCHVYVHVPPSLRKNLHHWFVFISDFRTYVSGVFGTMYKSMYSP